MSNKIAIKERDMREIKFRAWDRVNKKWLSVDELHNVIGAVAGYSMPRDKEPATYILGDWGSRVDSDKMEEFGIDWMQFTGLKDKNGKEIYEGDIVQCLSHKEIPLIIEYCDGAYEMILKEGGYAGKVCSYLPKQIEVIGNLYENGDLLK